MSGVSHKIDRFGVVFDDESLVTDAGLLAAATLMGRLGLGASVRLGRRAGAAACSDSGIVSVIGRIVSWVLT